MTRSLHSTLTEAQSTYCIAHSKKIAMRNKREVELSVGAIDRWRNDPNIHGLQKKIHGLCFKIMSSEPLLLYCLLQT